MNRTGMVFKDLLAPIKESADADIVNCYYKASAHISAFLVRIVFT